jgi:Tfp pilus assembly protein PilF
VSLLLQALQKAAKNREGSEAETEPGAKPAEVRFEVAPEKPDALSESLALAEEEIFEPDSMPDDEPAPSSSVALGSARASAASSAHAATILRASEARGQTWLDRVRDRPVHAFAILAGIFAVFYGIFVYLQIFHPAVLRGEFLTRPLQARTPPPPRTPIPPPPAAPVVAAPASLPATTAGVAALGAGSAAGTAKAADSAAAPIAGMPASGEKATKGGRPKKEVIEPAPREPAGAPRERPARRPVRPSEEVADVGDQVNVRVPEARPAQITTGLMDAWKALQEGRFEQAESLYQSVLQSEPNSVDAVLGLAAIAAHHGRTEQAMRNYERALELEPRNATAQAGLIAIIGQADPQMSETRLKQLIARDPSAYLYFSLGNVHARQNQWPQAQQAYFQAHQLQPDNPDYAYNLAIGLEHLSQPKIALSYYRKALELRGLKGNASFDQNRVQDRVAQLAARVGSE